MNSDDVNALISSRLAEFRFPAWEDDLSRNSLDHAPFENLAPISARIDEVPKTQAAVLSDVDIAACAHRDTAPIPCPDDREKYSAGYDGRYWLTGLQDFYSVLDIARNQNVSLRRVLDFGCASGRVIRHFVAQSEIPEIWGTDINARHIRWLCEFMPARVKPIANHCLPHLPMPDGHFDLVSAFSVFTHIDTFETCWLAELKRILAPGGIAYLTVHNEDTWMKLREEVDNKNNRLIQSMISIDQNIPEKLMAPMPDGRTVYRFTDKGPYRAQVFHSNRYLRNVWGRFFDIVDILPCHHIRQSVVVLKHLGTRNDG